MEDVPIHLRAPLWNWCETFLSHEGLIRRLGVELRLVLPDPGAYGGHDAAINILRTQAHERSTLMLDLVEYLLERHCGPDVYQRAWQAGEVLESTLSAGNSAYKVKEDMSGLEMRTTPEVQAQVQAVVDAASGSAGEHLTNAWNEAYARTPDPVKSYSESIKAVEAALAPVFSANNLKATLGTLIGTVRSDTNRWKFVIANGASSDGVQTVLTTMQLLWEGQTSRHGGVNPTRYEAADEAQAAVHLAATLVQFGVSGAISAR